MTLTQGLVGASPGDPLGSSWWPLLEQGLPGLWPADPASPRGRPRGCAAPAAGASHNCRQWMTWQGQLLEGATLAAVAAKTHRPSGEGRWGAASLGPQLKPEQRAGQTITSKAWLSRREGRSLEREHTVCRSLLQPRQPCLLPLPQIGA